MCKFSYFFQLINIQIFPSERVEALIEFWDFAEKNNLDLNVVKGAWKTNLEVRPEKDWEKLKGRAVSENE